jgi:NDP-sugar pyrophosphorylase family protein
MKAVILAGGKGTRLAPYTTILPKPLMPIGEMPILEILLRQLKKSGVDEVVITIGHLGHLLRSFFQDGSRLGLKISYSFEDQPLGTAGPLSLIKGLNEPFLVANGDILTNLDIANLIQTHSQSGAIATIATHFRKVKIDLGVLHYNSAQEITNYIEKPSFDFFVSMGIYVFEPRVIEYIPYNQYLDFPDLVLQLINNKECIKGFPFEGYWQDLGRPDDYAQAVIDFENLRQQILGE